jgi:hypothetical protein
VFNQVSSSLDYWSSTTDANSPSSSLAWGFFLYNGNLSNIDKSSGLLVWPVRGGQAASFGSLRIE